MPKPLAPKAVVPWTSDPQVELINPWRYGSLHRASKSLEMENLADEGRVIRVTGDFGPGASLNYDFGNGIKLDRRRYRFSFRVRGSPGQNVELEVADDWRGVSKEAKIPLTEDWAEHRIEFEIHTEFKDSTTLRFNLPHDAQGLLNLSQPRLVRLECAGV